MIIYLHGFLSSPDSTKAQRLRTAMAQRGLASEYVCPQLPMSPRAAAKLVLATAQMDDAEHLTLIGSSLGGFYATWAAEQLGCRAVLLNPAITPFEDLRRAVGAHA
ncbi:MAG TPA: YqiA/YcfP family alpha/beta fold hydrolase, partial [Burkholderiaceae bacterium]|nr:YqiA/YcfP family alpha/beta fold hydrolase [Burkholderiaceae bacterium]